MTEVHYPQNRPSRHRQGLHYNSFRAGTTNQSLVQQRLAPALHAKFVEISGESAKSG
jgi:hypothetical protein